MKPYRTYYFDTPQDMALSDVASLLNTQVTSIAASGYDVVSVQPHAGVVNGIPCTLGYTILCRDKRLSKECSNDGMPVLSVNVG